MLLHPAEVPRFVHLENPVRQPIRDLITIMARELGMAPNRAAGTLLPFEEWLKRAVDSGVMVSSLEGFFRKHFRVLGQGTIVLDTVKARRISKSLRSHSGVGKGVVEGYVRKWKGEGFLK